ncbi:peptidyl-prolyl cis-trans isomerase D [Sagittula marina]|uniref:Peptidyl-prolyl cis-trans isomerase D n=1 Tax=Sagittula marina TaxID=943940 RepID=A0A7W6GTK9_9RHOB|nr:peptidylprolyl isomerase [Sagittula marina]MBB3987646.1 peptidyl-prolyl cis-trans isomerase D [Sagittula marina]
MIRKAGGVGKTGGYILLGLLLLGLGGFGATNFGGTVSSIGRVGDTDIPAQDYFRNLRSEINAVQAETGEPLTFQQARAAGLPDAVLSRVVIAAALEDEAARMGLSVGDERLARDLQNVAGFQGVDGQFSRETYRLALENAGYTEAEFEENLRAESAATLLQTAVQGGVTLPDTYIDTLIGYAGERRAFTWAQLSEDRLDTGVAVPTDEELQAFYEDNLDRYTRPQTKQITYVWLTPSMIVDTVEVDEATLRAAYEERETEFNMPERRLVERLVMPNADAAQDAADRIAAGETTFEDVVDARGLELADTDLGDVARDDLGAAAETVFDANTGDVVIATSNLGPALYRVNAVLAAQETSFEDAIPDLRDTVALDRARRVIATQGATFDEELAAGVTLEELAETTELEQGQIGWNGQNSGDIAGYEAFGEIANAVTVDDYPAIEELGDGGIFALRVDEIQDAAPYAFDEIRDRVATDWEVDARADALVAQAEALKEQITDGASFEEVNLEARTEPGLTRTAFGAQIPPGALREVFEMEAGAVSVLKGNGTAFVLRLDEILPADTEGDAADQMRSIFAQQADQDVAQDLFRALAQNIQSRAGVSIDQAAVNAVNANFQ